MIPSVVSAHPPPALIHHSTAGLGSIHRHETWELNLFDPTALEGSTYSPTSQLTPTHTPRLSPHGLSSEPVSDRLGTTPIPSLSLAQEKETKACG